MLTNGGLPDVLGENCMRAVVPVSRRDVPRGLSAGSAVAPHAGRGAGVRAFRRASRPSPGFVPAPARTGRHRPVPALPGRSGSCRPRAIRSCDGIVDGQGAPPFRARRLSASVAPNTGSAAVSQAQRVSGRIARPRGCALRIAVNGAGDERNAGTPRRLNRPRRRRVPSPDNGVQDHRGLCARHAIPRNRIEGPRTQA